MTDLRKAAEAVLERWDSPAWEWKKQGPTADLMASLRTALAAEHPKQEPVAWMESPHGAIRANPNYRLNFPSQLLHWQIPLYAAPPDSEALRRDAERYRYLRNRDPKEVFNKSGKAAGVWIDWEDDMSGLQLLTGDDADAAIDAAMKEDKR